MRTRQPAQQRTPRVAFVLSGGGSHGAAQIGMLYALLEAGVHPDLIVGCSIGALNSVSLAINPTLERLTHMRERWLSFDSHDLAGSRRAWVVNLARRADHLAEPVGLVKLIREEFPIRDLGETQVPVHIVTTNLETARTAWWSTGDPVQVVLASAALPGLLPPVRLDGSLHVDGGVLDPVPVQHALDLGARTVVVLDVSGRPSGAKERMNQLEVLLHSFTISRYGNLPEPLLHPGQQVLRMPRAPQLDRVGSRDFRHTAELVDAGYETARSWLTTGPGAALTGTAEFPARRSLPTRVRALMRRGRGAAAELPWASASVVDRSGELA